MGTVRKIWARITSGRWKVIYQPTGTVVASYWTRGAAQDYSSQLNEALQYIGSKKRYEVRWM